MITLDQQVACARRELALRRNVYPKWIEARKMTAEKAQWEIDTMEAIVATLEKMKTLGDVSEQMKLQASGGPHRD
jgi:hypothetical protein